MTYDILLPNAELTGGTSCQKVFHIIIMVDTSCCMSGKKLNLVNEVLEKGIAYLKVCFRENELDIDGRISIMTMSNEIRWDVYNMPVREICYHTLSCGMGICNYEDGFRFLNEKLSRAKLFATPGKITCPWILLISGRNPIITEEMDAALDALESNGWFIHSNCFGAAFLDDLCLNEDSSRVVQRFAKNLKEGILAIDDAESLFTWFRWLDTCFAPWKQGNKLDKKEYDKHASLYSKLFSNPKKSSDDSDSFSDEPFEDFANYFDISDGDFI